MYNNFTLYIVNHHNPLSFAFSLFSYPAVNRYSSSSLSSQASNEVSNITGQSESSDEVFNMQVVSLCVYAYTPTQRHLT